MVCKKLVRFISFSRKMIAQRNNITVTVRTVEKNHYFNVMIQYDELRKLVWDRVYQVLSYTEGIWIDEKWEQLATK